MERRDLKEFSKDVKYLKEQKTDFQTMTGTYSCTIKTENGKIMYCNEKRGWGVFHAKNSIQKDIERFVSDFKPKKTDLIYNMFNRKYESIDIAIVDKVDIKSAYFTALIKSGHISEKTANLVRALPKHERLSSVGMLAYEPLVTRYENGEAVTIEVRKSPFRDIFFYCVEQVSVVMSEVMHALGEEFIFFWVDGIYFKPSYKSRRLVLDILDKHDYTYTYEEVKMFHVEHDEERVRLNYEEKGEKKEFCFPHPDVQKRRNMAVLIDDFRRSDKIRQKEILQKHFVLDEKDRIIF